MNKNPQVFFVICITAVFLAGCTAGPPPLSNETTPITSATTVPSVNPVDNRTCTSANDCVPARCCHPTSCVNQVSLPECNFPCTASCEGPLDCGVGSCRCVDGGVRLFRPPPPQQFPRPLCTLPPPRNGSHPSCLRPSVLALK